MLQENGVYMGNSERESAGKSHGRDKLAGKGFPNHIPGRDIATFLLAAIFHGFGAGRLFDGL